MALPTPTFRASSIAAPDLSKGTAMLLDALGTPGAMLKAQEEKERQAEIDKQNKALFDMKQQSWQQGQADRAAQLAYAKGIVAPRQEVLPSLTDAIDPSMQKKIDDIGYTQKEQDVMSAVDYDINKLDTLRNALVDKGVDVDTVASIMAKTEKQLGLSDTANALKPMQETRYEQAKRVMAGIDNPTPEMVKELATIEAADIEARKLKLKGYESRKEDIDKQLLKLDEEARKATLRYSKDGDKGVSAGKKELSGLKKDESLDSYIKNLGGEVSYFRLPGSDARDLQTIQQVGEKQGFSRDKIAWIAKNAIDKGMFGNNVETNAKMLNTLANEYDTLTKSGKSTAPLKGYLAEIEAKKKALEAEKAGISSSIVNLSRTPEQLRQAAAKKALYELFARPMPRDTYAMAEAPQKKAVGAVDEFGQKLSDIEAAEKRMLEADKKEVTSKPASVEDRVRVMQAEYNDPKTTEKRKQELQATAAIITRAEALRDKMARGGFTKMSDENKRQWKMLGDAIGKAGKAVVQGSKASTNALNRLVGLLDDIDVASILRTEPMLKEERNIVPINPLLGY